MVAWGWCTESDTSSNSTVAYFSITVAVVDALADR